MTVYGWFFVFVGLLIVSMTVEAIAQGVRERRRL